MNSTGSQGAVVTADVWEKPDMRAALAAREISQVYRLLRKHGISQMPVLDHGKLGWQGFSPFTGLDMIG